MAKISPFKFMQEVRAEAQKVTWPSRRETAVTTAMVFVMVAIASVFFLVADQLMRMVVTFVLGIDLLPAAHFYDLLGRYHHFLEQVVEVALLRLLANGIGDLALEIRVGLHDVPMLLAHCPCSFSH